jgi:hypothetical protein
MRMDELVRTYLTATRDARAVSTDPNARYYGIEVNDQSLTLGGNPRLGSTQFEEWLRRQGQ